MKTMKLFKIGSLMMLILAGCNIQTDTIVPTLPNIVIESATEAPLSTPSTEYTDASLVMSGLCWGAMFELRDTPFVIMNAEQHIEFYNQVDQLQRCPRPITRYPHDFNDGSALVGIWSYGMGCTAQHTITNFERDEATQTINIQAQFTTQGECNYELLRPLWLSIPNVQEFQITLISD
jgi:hypothetical protein